MKRSFLTSNHLKLLTLFLALVSLASCNPIFVMQAAYEQSKILVARKPLDEVIADPDTASDDKIKLLLVTKVREYTETIGLKPGSTFTTYTKLDKDPVAWVVSGSKKDSFTPYVWWFPIVGSIPYRGYFDKEDAIEASRELEGTGSETWVRGTAAFSTLGWFNDPLLSSTLKLSAVDVVNTVIHETVHSTLWIPGSVAFNESLANYVGNRAAVDFFTYLATAKESPVSEQQRQQFLDQSKIEYSRELEISDIFAKLYDSLTVLYASNATSEEKIAQREEVLKQDLAEFRIKYPGLPLLPKVNNAEIMQRKLYLTKLRDFDRLFVKAGSDWTKFMEQIKKIREEAGEDEQAIFSTLAREALIQENVS